MQYHRWSAGSNAAEIPNQSLRVPASKSKLEFYLGSNDAVKQRFQSLRLFQYRKEAANISSIELQWKGLPRLKLPLSGIFRDSSQRSPLLLTASLNFYKISNHVSIFSNWSLSQSTFCFIDENPFYHFSIPVFRYNHGLFLLASGLCWYQNRKWRDCRLSCTFFSDSDWYPHVVFVLFSNEVLALSRGTIVISIVCR